MKSVFPYILAVLVGLSIPFVPEIEPFPITLGIIFLICGSIFGFLWPKESWRWGLWIVGPLFLLIMVSVLFAGQLDVFFKKDLPKILIAITATSIGSALLARYKKSRTQKGNQ